MAAYSASGSASTSQGLQQRFDQQFGAINNATGLQIPSWVFIAGLLLGVGLVIGGLVWLMRKE